MKMLQKDISNYGFIEFEKIYGTYYEYKWHFSQTNTEIGPMPFE